MICDIIKTILVILVLRQEVSSQLIIEGIPNKANHGDVYRLRCSDTPVGRFWRVWRFGRRWGLWGKAQFNRNFNHIVTVDAGISWCAVDQSNVVYVRVQYPLTLNITIYYTSEAIELICRVVDGYPTNFTMKNWRHYIDGQFVREIEGVTTEDGTALVLNNTKLNEGTYVCNASNGIKDFKGSVYQTDETNINIEAPPIVLEVSNASETRVGSNVKIKATFIIGGDDYNITWYQQQQNGSTITEISVDTKSEHGIRPVDIYGTEINKNVTIISGSVTISKMVDITVTVTVCTQNGCTDAVHSVRIVPEDQRIKPFDSAMESLTYSGLEIGGGEGRLESAYDDLTTYVNQGVAITSSNDPPVWGVANTSRDDPPVSGEVLNNRTYDSLQPKHDAM